MIVGSAPLLTLPAGGPLAVAGGRAAMWVAAGDPPRLTKFDPATGEPAAVEPLEAPALGIVAAGAAVVVAAAEQSWLLDADTLARVGTVPLGQVRWLAAGGEAVWAATAQGAVQRLVGGRVDEAAAVGPVAGLTADRRGAWVAIEDDAALRRIDPDLRVTVHDPGIDPRTRGGLTACANACWVGGVDELVAVTDDGRRLGPFATPEGVGKLTPLACVGGAVLGGGRLERMVVLDPAADAEATHVAIPGSGQVTAVVAAGPFGWIVTGERTVWLVER